MRTRKSSLQPLRADVELVFDDFNGYNQPANPSDTNIRYLHLHQDEELNQLLIRLKRQFTPRPAYLHEGKLDFEASPTEDPYLTGVSSDPADSVASVVEIESSSAAPPSLNSTISRLANYLSDKHRNLSATTAEENEKHQQQKQQNQPNLTQLKQPSKALESFPLHPHQVSVAAVKARLFSMDQEKRFSCYICQRRFHLFAHLRNHLETHSGEKPHDCDQCGKCFSTLTSLKRHLPVHQHSDKKYRCTVCDKAYANQGYLKVHMRIHRDEKPFDCELCGRAFRQLAHLNHHLLTHTGDKPHKCDLCGQRFRQANTLEDHMRLHTGERPHCCRMCGKRFTHRLSLKLHMKYHAKDVNNSDIAITPNQQQKQSKQVQQQYSSHPAVEIIAD